MSAERGWNIGGTHPPRNVKCRGCKAPLVRRAYFKRALCADCKKIKRLDEDELRRQQARRFRILMHVMGYELDAFAEALADLKSSDMALREAPETRDARVDVTVEKRVSRKRAARVA
jgi:hypothetical protein